MANFLSCTGTVQSLLNFYNKMFSETATNHEHKMIDLANQVSELAIDVTTKTTNTGSTLKYNSKVTATTISEKIECYVKNVKNIIQVVSGANFDETQLINYHNLPSSIELNENVNNLKSMFDNFYNQAYNFVSSTLMDVLDTPYKVNTVAIFPGAVATPVNDQSCFAIKSQVKKQLENQQEGINQDFAAQYKASVNNATQYFNDVTAKISAAKITVNKTAECNALVDSITKVAIDLFGASISNSNHDESYFANHTDIKSVQDSLKQDVCVTVLSSVVTEINSVLEVLGQINVGEIA